ncbi:uncharacterized protein EAF01_010995 [Botrytis porri]|uniref:Uncharacterized protein n=1 Tax=Botrytis porri TaxID=87229 RepID=A0A4Z1KDX0_9HELO|nr:uncharacterized protein EAF01_010995 [Botrytis porri]KAF7887841.1 hypothetical protein EAF01_010995 [Botrytis porri]TGO83576.1 hypothetical protein BPOR_0625g00090 [Botrytis porri]
MCISFSSPSPAHSPLESLRPANPTPYHPENLPSILSPFFRPSNPTPYHPQNLPQDLEETRSICRVLKEAGFINIVQFLDSHDLREDEKNRILRAWEFNEGMREDCLVQNAKEEILMQRENGVDAGREKENEVFALFVCIKKQANTVKAKVLGEKKNFITHQAPIPQKTSEEMNYSSDESYFSSF